MIANIAIGSNLGQPQRNVEVAIARLSSLGYLRAKSSLYATKPWGIEDQPDFCNAVVQIDTQLGARELLAALKGIEDTMGRTPTYRWGPRLIDLDLLTFDNVQMNEPELTLPHPRMYARAFVLVPLAEIDPSYCSMRDQLPKPDLAGVALQNCTG
jgi:2-amino-4-hydroxy-6-hydroxymethyldihydropteridine diphosphokinase